MNETTSVISRLGPIRLENTETYPFNNSAQLIPLERELPDPDYTVVPEVLAAGGAVGQIVVSGRAVNGFHLAYTGSAPWVELRCTLLGGGL